MMISAEPRGMRVGEIVKLSSLSRPAVSHHMRILKDAGVINVRKEGTKNYYYLDPDMLRLLYQYWRGPLSIPQNFRTEGRSNHGV